MNRKWQGLPFDTAVPWWVVVSLRNRFYIKNFVETGTGYGDTALGAAGLFRRVYTVELAADVFRDQYRDLQKAENVARLCGNTVDVLRQWMPELTANGPNLFYCDAHWPGLGPKHGPECPLLDELEVICDREEVMRDIVMIDNAGLFIDPPPPPHEPSEWPTVQSVKKRIFDCWPTARFTTFFDTFIISEEPLVIMESAGSE